MGHSAETNRQPRSPLKVAGLILFGLCLFGGFTALGTWQLYRLQWKLGLIARVNKRVNAAPQPPPARNQWPDITAKGDQYLHIKLTGHYLKKGQSLVRASTKLGRGYWVMTPLQTAPHFIVYINRGFVPSKDIGPPLHPVPPPSGQVTVTGLLRINEPGGQFLRPNHPEHDQWYSRDVIAMARHHHLPPQAVAPYFIDQNAHSGHPKWPVGGLTRIHFRNAHLEYALTWYGLALLVLIAAVITIRYEKTEK